MNDLLEAEAAINDARHPSDVGEVLNYVEATNHGLARLAELPVSTRLIREIHHRLLDGVRSNQSSPGEIRRSQNWIGPAGCGINDATYVPPPPERLWECLDSFEKYLHAHHTLPPLVTIGCLHYQLEAIHPFMT